MRSLVLPLALLAALASSAAALAPDSLQPPMTSEEQQYYDSIKADQNAGNSFLVTREYVRKANAVNNGTLSPLKFPGKKPAGFSVEYLLPDDPSAINQALGKYLNAKMAPGNNPWLAVA